ncbi:hypothetical protein ASU32_23160 [Tsukamurella tyrosinosolvens]|nr:hypothetical protein ASU32_23160 [Tsukamurella tyrosinosolvens]
MTFMGVVHPVAGGWFLEKPLLISSGGDDVRLTLNRSAFNMQVIAVDEPSDSVPTDEIVIGALLKHEPTLKGVLDALSFHVGATLTAEFINGNVGTAAHLGTYLRNERFATTGENGRGAGEQLGPFAETAVGLPAVRFALADIAQAMKLDGDCGFYCYRAIESLRQTYVGEGAGARERSWASLHADLGTERKGILAAIQEDAEARRHGDHSPSTPEERADWVTWSRNVIDVFIGKHSVSGVAIPWNDPTGGK